MKALTTKQQEREEKKKKKLAALANLVQMNDKDRLETLNADRATADEADNNAVDQDVDDDGFIKVSHKKKSNKAKTDADGEPQIKRARNSSECNGTEDGSNASDADEELQKMKLSLTTEQYKALKLQLRERKRQLENVPILRLREFGRRALVDLPAEQRTPIFLTDIQHLLMSAVIGKKTPCTPDRWCFLENPVRLSHSVVLILEGLSLYHYMSNESKFTQANKIFDTKLEVVLPTPSAQGNNIMQHLTQVPLTIVQARTLIEEHGCLETAIEMNKDPTLLVKAIFPMTAEKATASKVANEKLPLPPSDKFPRTKLLLSALQMVEEGYPMPLRGELTARFGNYVYTNDSYAPVTDHSPMFGVDCEMCRTSAGRNELTRISIVNEKLETIYETLVMPSNKITDYLTQYSGITEQIMKTVTKRLDKVQREVRALLPPDAILVGQSLNSDLNAMKMMHPYVIDTSVCFNITGMRKRKSKLQTLSMTFLKEMIQENEHGHDSVEDSLATLKLVKMKLANSMSFGDEILLQKQRLNEIIRMASGDNIKNNLLAHATSRDKSTAIVTSGALHCETKQLLDAAKQAAACEQNTIEAVSLYELDTNKAAVQKAREIALQHSLTIAQLQLSDEHLLPDAADKTMEKVDKWIGKMWKTIAHNGMFLVLMGGSQECPSGLAKIAIKKNVGDVAAETPITV